MTGHEHRAGGPWWASGADGLAEDVDPLDAHRRARGGDREPPPSPGDAPRTGVEEALEMLAALVRAAARRGARTSGGARARVDDPACRGCPWCTLTRSLGDARPEVTEHLEQAARHVVLAARAWVDAADERTGRWEPIPLDDDEEQP